MSLDTHICELKLILTNYAKIQVCPVTLFFIEPRDMIIAELPSSSYFPPGSIVAPASHDSSQKKQVRKFRLSAQIFDQALLSSILLKYG